MSSPSPIRVSILGTGSSLRTFHYPSVSQLPGKFVLHSVLERTDRGVARDVCGSEIKVVNSLNARLINLLQVVIATPDNTHFDFAKAALLAGKHGT
jgi:predicted dehydrogenase